MFYLTVRLLNFEAMCPSRQIREAMKDLNSPCSLTCMEFNPFGPQMQSSVQQI